jgi:hypothetical protein
MAWSLRFALPTRHCPVRKPARPRHASTAAPHIPGPRTAASAFKTIAVAAADTSAAMPAAGARSDNSHAAALAPAPTPTAGEAPGPGTGRNTGMSGQAQQQRQGAPALAAVVSGRRQLLLGGGSVGLEARDLCAGSAYRTRGPKHTCRRTCVAPRPSTRIAGGFTSTFAGGVGCYAGIRSDSERPGAHAWGMYDPPRLGCFAAERIGQACLSRTRVLLRGCCGCACDCQVPERCWAALKPQPLPAAGSPRQ